MHDHIHSYTDHNDLSTHHVDGELTSIGIKGLFGGKTYLSPDGHMIGRTEPNVLGGKDTFHEARLVDHNVSYKNGVIDPLHPEHSYTTIKGLGGTHIQHADGSEVHYQDLGHGFTSVMNFSDPLMHISSYKVPPINL
jgi:hypothetical protein